MSHSSADESAKATAQSGYGVLRDRANWDSAIATIAARFNREYSGKLPELPDEVKSMPIYQERQNGLLQAKLTSPFWQLAKPQKNQRCLDIGCGVSFLIYAWREWDAFFYGHEVSAIARDLLNSRGPQLNSKLFKGVQLAPAHQLTYDAGFFDLVISTGVSCYYPLSYWTQVMGEVKRILKPGGCFIFDVVDAELATAENWAILETYLGAEVHLDSLIAWKRTIQAAGAKVVKSHSGEIFQLLKVTF